MRGIEEIKKECERILGKTIVTPTNFDELSLDIKKSTGRNVSVSTLKRLWGYVDYPHKPSHEILSILSVYVGFKDWHDFINTDSVTDSSDFIGADIIKSSELKRGSHILIRWKPDRLCVLEYHGNSEFQVIEAQNSKLIESDIFSCSVIAKGKPLICHDVRREGKLIAEGYVAGKTDGIISFQIMK